MEIRERISTRNQSPIHNSVHHSSPNRNDESKEIIELISPNLGSRRGTGGSLSSRVAFAPKSLTLSSPILEIPNHVRSPYQAGDQPRSRPREDIVSNMLEGIMHESPRLKSPNKRARREGSKEFTEPLKSLLRHPYIKEPTQPIYTRERNRSIGGLTLQSDALLLPSKHMNSPTKGGSQAYVMAMKALQEKIRELEERISQDEMVYERRQNDHRAEIESLSLKHQECISQLAQSERSHKERSEMFERQYMEANSRARNLEEENLGLSRQIKELLMERSDSGAYKERYEKYERQCMEADSRIKSLEEQNLGLSRQVKEMLVEKSEIEEKYGKLISEKVRYQDAYEELEKGVDRLQRNLESALGNEKLLQDRLRQTVAEFTYEKEALKAKNDSLADALRRIEQEFDENKRALTVKLEEANYKSRVLEQEMEQVKRNFSQQMLEFDQELAEIEKSHAIKVEAYEIKMADLREQLEETQDLLDIAKKEVLIRTQKPIVNEISTPQQKSILKEVSTPQSSPKLTVNAETKPKSSKPASNETTTSQSPSKRFIGLDDPGVARRVGVSHKRAQSSSSPMKQLKNEGSYFQNHLRLKKDLKVKIDLKSTISEENTETDTNSGRNRNSPLRSEQSVKSPNSFTVITKGLDNSQKQKTLKEASPVKKSPSLSNIKSLPQTPSIRSSDKDFDKYLSPQNGNTPRNLTINTKPCVKFADDLSGWTPMSGLSSLQEPAKKSQGINQQDLEKKLNPEATRPGQRSPSQRSPSRHSPSQRSPERKEASDNIIKKAQELRMSCAKALSGSPRKGLSSFASEALETKINTKEKELVKLNEEYQYLVKKTQEAEDAKERSRMRAHLIELTEEIQKGNDEIYQLKKQGVRMKN